jgi:hypothetical protein
VRYLAKKVNLKLPGTGNTPRCPVPASEAILDGRNRYRAMLAAGHTPTEGHFQKYKPALATNWQQVASWSQDPANLHRRPLSNPLKINRCAGVPASRGR